MSGNWINHRQIEVYMNMRGKGCSQLSSAAKAGISERSGRAIEKSQSTAPASRERHWRTRTDPLEGIWDEHLVPLLEDKPNLQPITLLEHLQDKWPGKYSDRLLRTLQRRVKQWRAISGPDKEVMFRQTHPPGLQAQSDFTTLKNVKITIKQQPLAHRLYHFRLSFSHWSYLKVTLGGESYTALADGLQSALWRLGGSPKEHRTDSLSAAYKNLSQAEQNDITTRYAQFCSYYGMKATRNNRGKANENGGVEGGHGHLKRRIEQALLLRGCADFDSVSDYQTWLDEVVSAYNCRNAKAIDEELKHLNPLPENKTTSHTDVSAVVTSSSTIDVRRVTYTVPSRLIGECLRIRLYDDRLEAYLGSEQVIQLPRIYPTQHQLRARRVDYRHVIHSLVKKPQAFRYSRLRDDLLPSPGFKRIWHYADKHLSSRYACRFMVGILALAAKQSCEKVVEQAVLEAIAKKELLELTAFEQQFAQPSALIPTLQINQHVLSDYNALLDGGEL